ncbi:hypothetical protein UO65_0849 [Actinokineospora spheciospongiae]|uniref:Uncharacterized protein n=1 Tax=Actinokineospora spheciospongiae TaxID=909613 RepID=W7ISA8_9PSEU|nr:hypothetical protein UO65_0849 [Actinokineospora spheciospongiae]
MDWRLFLLEFWDDHKAAEEQTAAEIARKRACCAIAERVGAMAAATRSSS